MLSFNKGRPIAIIKGGIYNGKILNIFDPNTPCCEKCSENCLNKKKCCKECRKLDKDVKSLINYDDPYTVIDEDEIRKHRKKLKNKDIDNIINALSKNSSPSDKKLDYVYNKVKKQYDELIKKEFKIYDDGVIQPIPNVEKDSERMYVAGPTDSGKTYYVSKYVTEFKKLFPDKKIYLISDVSKDHLLDDLVKRIEFNDEEFVSDPISPEELKNSLVIFDDIDSIQNKTLFKSVEALRDSLLRRGRHENISVIVTSHLLNCGNSSRIIMNECSSFTIYPKSGSTHAITYLLKKYCGFNASMINKIFSLPSRWVTIYKNFPIYVLYEKGAFLL